MCRSVGINEAEITAAARNLAKLRLLTAEEAEANLGALEDEVIRHLEVSQAIVEVTTVV